MLTTASLAVSKQMLHSKIDSSFLSSSFFFSADSASGVASFELPATTVGSSRNDEDVDGCDSRGFVAAEGDSVFDTQFIRVGSSSTSGTDDDDEAVVDEECTLLPSVDDDDDCEASDSSILVIVTLSIGFSSSADEEDMVLHCTVPVYFRVNCC